MNLRQHLKKTERRREMHAAISRLETVIEDKGQNLAATSHYVWRTKMRSTMVKTMHEIRRIEQSWK